MENNLLGEKRRSFGIYEAALATILFIVFQECYSFLLQFLPLSFRKLDIVYFAMMVLNSLMFVFSTLLVCKIRNVDFKLATTLNKKFNGNCVFYGILISFVSLFFFGNLTNAFMNFMGLLGYQPVLSNIVIDSFGSYILYILMLCVAPAVCEEIMFRGTIASGLKEKGYMVALIGSSLIFTFMHGNPDQTIHQFIIGLIIGVLFLKTSNVWLGIIIHFVNNFISVSSIYASSFISEAEVVAETGEAAVIEYGWSDLFYEFIIAIFMAMLGYFIVKILIKKLINENNKIINNQEIQEGATIKVDDAEVKVEMSIDGNSIEEQKEDNISEKKDKKMTPISVIIMFVAAGAYFAFSWLTYLFIGLGF